MKHLLTLLAAIVLCASSEAQTVKALSYGTNGRFITGTNSLTFSNQISFADGDVEITDGGMIRWAGSDRIELETYTLYGEWQFNESGSVRANLGFSTNLNTLWTATNASNARSAVGLGANDSVLFADILASAFETLAGEIQISADAITSKANIIITNQSATNNGLLFIYRTNNESFLGLANLIASNNTTVSNETLFRVGVSEATNKAAQFGFRSTNTNGSGVAVFSVFGFNALMQIGADASTNAVIFSGGGTNNQVMTLIKNGTTEFSRPVAWNNTTNAAATRTNLQIPLPALTNTSNVTMMRALAGTTNTNMPLSGTMIIDPANTYEMVVSNGIILDFYVQ